MQKYKQKIVLAGNILEIQTFSDYQFYGFENKRKNYEKHNAGRTMLSNSRAGFFIRHLVNANPNLKVFITLTFEDNVKDLTFSNNEFKKFVKRVKYQFGYFKYVCVVEFQKRGAVHYHIICDVPFIDKLELPIIWRWGSTSIDLVKNSAKVREYLGNVGAVFSKHGMKNNYKIECEKLAGRRKFFCSRDLVRPMIFRKKENVNYYLKKVENLKPFFKKDYVIQLEGKDLKINYQQFKIERKVNKK